MRRKVTSEHILCKYPPFLVEECGSRPDHQSVICFLTILDSHLFTLDPWLRTYVVGDESFPSLEVQIWSVPSDICEVSSLKKYGCQFWMLCSSNVWFIDDIDVYWLAAWHATPILNARNRKPEYWLHELGSPKSSKLLVFEGNPWWKKTYFGWKKSCTTLDGRKPKNHGINHLSTGAGFLPSTVSLLNHWSKLASWQSAN